MKLTKIYADDCEVCKALGSSASVIAKNSDFEYEEVELMALAAEPGAFRDYIVNYHVDPNTGMMTFQSTSSPLKLVTFRVLIVSLT